jgi:glycosyltransferase 2 family protein
MKKKIVAFVAGCLLSLVLVYLSIRGVDFGKVVEGFKAVKGGYVLLFLAIALFIQILRSVRWGMMLSPLENVDQWSLFAVSSVGFLAIMAMPARLGELARPYLITKKSQIRMSSAMGTIFVERIFDSIAILSIFGLLFFFIPSLPGWLITSGVLVLLITAFILAFMIIMIVKRETSLRMLAPFIERLPDKISTKTNLLINHFIDGLQMIADMGLLFRVLFLSFLIWLINVLAIYSMFLAFGFHLTLTAAAVLMVILLIGIAIPTAPGFIGNWHYACILGLTMYGIDKAAALSFGVVYHFLSLGMAIVLGLIFLPFNRFSLADLKMQASARPDGP